MKKIYVHHKFGEYLFKILTHNSKTIRNNINEHREGDVVIDYKGNKYTFIFDTVINDNLDGYHLIDIGEAYMSIRRGDDNKFIKVEFENNYYTNLYKVFNAVNQIVDGKKNWILTVFFGEKLFFDDIASPNPTFNLITNEMENFLQHKVYTDNIPYKTTIKNHTFPLSSVLMFWYFRARIMVYSDYGKLHDMINHTHLWSYQIKRHKNRRTEIGRLLNKTKVFVSQTDFNDSLMPISKSNPLRPETDMLYAPANLKIIDGAYYNNMIGNNDFENKFNGYIESDKVGMDMFFCLLPKGKGVIVDETWSGYGNFKIQYLSEKTYGMILAKIPFITTASYPLDLIKTVIGGNLHPFYEQIKEYEMDVVKLVDWVNLLDEVDLKRCKIWVDEIHQLMMDNIMINNHFLDNLDKNIDNSII
jgi:hypothetical protein